jgi:transposase-like protein
MQLTNAQYLNKSGLHCPFCDSDDIQAHTPQPHEEGIDVPVNCHSCGSEWTDEFKLVGYRE